MKQYEKIILIGICAVVFGGLGFTISYGFSNNNLREIIRNAEAEVQSNLERIADLRARVGSLQSGVNFLGEALERERTFHRDLREISTNIERENNFLRERLKEERRYYTELIDTIANSQQSIGRIKQIATEGAETITRILKTSEKDTN